MPKKDDDVKEIGGFEEEASRAIIHARQFKVPSLPGTPVSGKKQPETKRSTR